VLATIGEKKKKKGGRRIYSTSLQTLIEAKKKKKKKRTEGTAPRCCAGTKKRKKKGGGRGKKNPTLFAIVLAIGIGGEKKKKKRKGRKGKDDPRSGGMDAPGGEGERKVGSPRYLPVPDLFRNFALGKKEGEERKERPRNPLKPTQLPAYGLGGKEKGVENEVLRRGSTFSYAPI